MVEILRRGTPPAPPPKFYWKATCGTCGTVARFQEYESNGEIRSTMGEYTRTPLFTCPVCDADNLYGVKDGEVERLVEPFPLQETGETVIEARGSWNTYRGAQPVVFERRTAATDDHDIPPKGGNAAPTLTPQAFTRGAF